ncbi:MAG TPA: hypothetical protein VJL82_07000, partial [Rhizomicrobium sp.]|nr:hypothetical protein [Rhizomicrobium sp.]
YLRDGGPSVLFNCGYGRGFSVREVAAEVGRVNGKPLAIEYAPRRPGDLGIVVAQTAKLTKTLGWTPKYQDLETIVKTALTWERRVKDEMDAKA